MVFGVEKSSISLLKTILVDGDITPENIEMCFDRKSQSTTKTPFASEESMDSGGSKTRRPDT